MAHEISDAVVLSGLLDRAERVFVSLVGSQDRSLFPPDSASFELIGSIRENVFEFPALEQLHCEAEVGNFFACYAHTKGITSGAHDHRRYLIGHTIWRWRECVQRLSEGYDAAGADFRHQDYLHFPGNFWWARSDYVRKLCAPRQGPTGGKAERFRAEGWVGSKGPKSFIVNWKGDRPPNFYLWEMPKRLFTWNL